MSNAYQNAACGMWLVDPVAVHSRLGKTSWESVGAESTATRTTILTPNAESLLVSLPSSAVRPSSASAPICVSKREGPKQWLSIELTARQNDVLRPTSHFVISAQSQSGSPSADLRSSLLAVAFLRMPSNQVLSMKPWYFSGGGAINGPRILLRLFQNMMA